MATVLLLLALLSFRSGDLSPGGSPARACLGAAGSRSGVAQPSRSDAVGALDGGAVVPSPGPERGAPPPAGDATGTGLDPDKVAPMVVPAVHVPVLRELVDRWNAALDAGDDPARSRAAAELVGAVEYLLRQHAARTA